MTKKPRLLKDYRISRLSHDTVLVNTLEHIDIVTLDDLMHCQFRRLMRSRVVLNHWDSLISLIHIARIYIDKEPKKLK